MNDSEPALTKWTMRHQLCAMLLAALAALATLSPASAAPRPDCPVTIPTAGLLGKPFPSSDHWYGSETLAVMLRPEGIWRGMGSQYRYRDKLFWWSHGFKPGLESNLRVSAKRVDGESPPAWVSRTTNAGSGDDSWWAMLVLVEFPSAGCWEITGDYLGQRLSFVVDVRADP